MKLATVIGVDVGATKARAGLVTLDGQVLGATTVPTPARDGADAVVATILTVVDLVRAEAAAFEVGPPVRSASVQPLSSKPKSWNRFIVGVRGGPRSPKVASAPLVDRITFGGNILDSGTDSYCLAHRKPVSTGPPNLASTFTINRSSSPPWVTSRLASR